MQNKLIAGEWQSLCACMYSRGNPVIGDVDMIKDIGGFVTGLYCVVQTLTIIKCQL